MDLEILLSKPINYLPVYRTQGQDWEDDLGE